MAAILIAFVPTLFLPNHAPQAAGDASSPGAAQDNEAGGPPVARAALD